MNILLDECVPRKLKNSLSQHKCQTVGQAGLAGLKNGELLVAAESGRFDVLITVDQGIEYQQDLADRKIAILVLQAKSNRLKDLLPLTPACLDHLTSIRPGEIVKIGN